MSIWNKKIVILSILLLSVCLLCSCKKEDISEDTHMPNPYEDMERVYAVGYAIMNDEGNYVINATAKDLSQYTSFPLNEKYGINMPNKKITLEDVSQVKNIPFLDEKEYFYDYSTYRRENSESDKVGTFYSIYDYYVNELEIVAYLNGSNILCHYDKFIPSGGSDEDYVRSREEYIEIAEKFLLNIVSEDYLSELKLDESNTRFSGKYRYVVEYNRYIEGYSTDENIRIVVDISGVVCKYDAFNLKKYDEIKKNITKEHLEAAEDALNKKLKTFDEIELEPPRYPMITTNANGEFYLQRYFIYNHTVCCASINILDIK